MLISQQRKNQLIKEIGKATFHVKRLKSKGDDRVKEAEKKLEEIIDATIKYCSADKRFDKERFLEDCDMFCLACQSLLTNVRGLKSNFQG